MCAKKIGEHPPTFYPRLGGCRADDYDGLIKLLETRLGEIKETSHSSDRGVFTAKCLVSPKVKERVDLILDTKGVVYIGCDDHQGGKDPGGKQDILEDPNTGERWIAPFQCGVTCRQCFQGMFQDTVVGNKRGIQEVLRD